MTIDKIQALINSNLLDNHNYNAKKIKRNINKLTIEQQKFMIQKNPYNIIWIKNPSEELQLEAINTDPSILSSIKNPTPKVIETALILEPSNLRNRKGLSYKLICHVVKNNPAAIEYIKNPTKKIINIVLKSKDKKVLCYVINKVSKPQQKKILKEHPDIIYYISKSKKELVNFCAKIHPEAFFGYIFTKFIKYLTRENLKLVLSHCGDNLEHVKNPDKELQKIAVNNFPLAIQCIRNPANDIKILAITKSKFDINVISYINLTTLPQSFIDEIYNNLIIKDIIQ